MKRGRTYIPAGAVVGFVDYLVLLSNDTKWNHDENHRKSPGGERESVEGGELQLRHTPGNEVGSEGAERMPDMDRHWSLLDHLQYH